MKTEITLCFLFNTVKILFVKQHKTCCEEHLANSLEFHSPYLSTVKTFSTISTELLIFVQDLTYKKQNNNKRKICSFNKISVLIITLYLI